MKGDPVLRLRNQGRTATALAKDVAGGALSDPRETVLSAVKRVIAPPDRRPPWQWCEENIIVDQTSAFGAGQLWRSELSPWVRLPMEWFADPFVRVEVIRCAAQTAKTMLEILCANWAVAVDPGPMLWVTASRDDVRSFGRTRLLPTFRRNKALKGVIPDKTQDTAISIQFPAMPFELVGAGSPSKLQSRPVRYLILDEARNYPPGALSMVWVRTRTYDEVGGSKKLVATTGSTTSSEIEKAYLNGSQHEPFYRCMGCKGLVPLRYRMKPGKDGEAGEYLMRFGEEGVRRSEYRTSTGTWDFDRISPTIRHVCPHCGHAHYDKPRVRRHMIETLEFIPQNPDAPRSDRSMTWPAFIARWVSFRSVVEAGLKAYDSMKHGDMQPLMKFVTEWLGESYDDTLSDWKERKDIDKAKSRKYSLGPVASRGRRFMGCDRQAKDGDHYWWEVREVRADGEIRLVNFGKLDPGPELEERLEQIRVEYGVEPPDLLVDSGYKATETYKACARYGWTPMKGVPQGFFLGVDEAGAQVRKIVQATFPQEYARIAGERRPLVLWCNDPHKDALAYLLDGNGKWTVPADVPFVYVAHQVAEERVQKMRGGRLVWVWRKVRDKEDDHLRDCSLMILAAVMDYGLLAVSASDLPEAAQTESGIEDMKTGLE